jgi:hypothetical protein
MASGETGLKASQARTNALEIGVSDTMQIREIGNDTVASVNGVKAVDQAADQLLLSGSRFAHFSGVFLGISDLVRPSR